MQDSNENASLCFLLYGYYFRSESEKPRKHVDMLAIWESNG